MAFYRVYEYPNAIVPYKHVYIKRDRIFHCDREPSLRDKVREAIEKGEKFDESISRAKRTITELALCNDFEYFCTFTFNGAVVDRYSMKECSKRLRTFLNNFKKRYAPNFFYLIIPEYHKDGAVHFHGLCSGFPEGELIVPETIIKRDKWNGELLTVPNTKGYFFWQRYDKSLGIFNCSQIRSRHASAFYILKYVTKDLKTLEKGMPVYMCSKGLKRPELVFDEDDIPFLLSTCYENDYVKVGYEIKEDTDAFMDELGYYTPWGYAPCAGYIAPEDADDDTFEEVYLCEQMELVGYRNGDIEGKAEI